jgi:TonB family protein
MISRRSLLLVLTLTSLVCAASASKKDAEAATLIEHSKQLSDIRAEGAPAFRLKMNFKIIKEDGSVLGGSHTEIWASNTQWRRETVLGEFRETQVVSGRKRWVLNSSTTIPEHLGDFLGLTDISSFQPKSWKPQKIADREIDGHSARCIETEPDPRGASSVLCFDKIGGTIDAYISPSEIGNQVSEIVCIYGDYEKFGDRVLARSYECGKNKHPILQARVVELTADTATDPAFFTPPAGAKESVRCLGPMKAPAAIYNPDPERPRNSGGQTQVGVYVLVGTDGKTRNLNVISTPNPDFDKAALEAVRHWTFKPAACDGEPVEVGIDVYINFP